MRQARVLVGAALGMAGGFAALYFGTMAVFLKPLAQEFGWDRGPTAAATALAMAGMAVGALIVGRLIDRWGAARVILLSAVLMSALMAMMSRQSGNPWATGALCFFIGVTGTGTTPLGYLSVLPRWFDRRLGLALGAAMVGLGLGTMVFPVMAQQFITNMGWRTAYVVLAAISLVLSLLAWCLVFAGGREGAVTALAGPVAHAEQEGLTLGQAARTGRYWLLLVIVFLVSAAGLGMAVHGLAHLTDRGMNAQAAAQIGGMAGLGVVLGRLLAGGLMDRWSAPPVGAGSFALGALGIALYAYGSPHSMPTMMAAGFLAALCIGAEGDFIPYTVRIYFGARSFGAIFGTLFGVYALGGLLGPIAFGIVFDRQGSYQNALNAASAACVLAALACAMLGRGRYGRHH